MSNKRIPKKFKTSWGAEYTVYVNDTSDATNDDEQIHEANIVSEIDSAKWKNVILLLIAVGLFIFGINHKSDQSTKKHKSNNFSESNSNSVTESIQEIHTKNK